jgi:hypothetical protein
MAVDPGDDIDPKYPQSWMRKMKSWTPSHTFLLIMSPISILAAYYFRRFQDDSNSPYNVALRRFRIALLIGGFGGLFGLLRLLFMD